MSAVLVTLLLWGALLLAVALVALLLMPVRLSASVQTSPRLIYRLDARFLGNWMPSISLMDSTRPRHGKSRRAGEQQAWLRQAASKMPKARKRGPGWPDGARMLGALPRLLGEVLRSVHCESLHLDAEFGLNDPADTGQLYGCLTPLQYGAPWPPCVSIALWPNFSRACLCGELQTTLRLRMAALLPPAARFAWRAFGPRP